MSFFGWLGRSPRRPSFPRFWVVAKPPTQPPTKKITLSEQVLYILYADPLRLPADNFHVHRSCGMQRSVSYLKHQLFPAGVAPVQSVEADFCSATYDLLEGYRFPDMLISQPSRCLPACQHCARHKSCVPLFV